MLTQIKQAPNELSMISNLVSLKLRDLLEDTCEANGIQDRSLLQERVPLTGGE